MFNIFNIYLINQLNKVIKQTRDKVKTCASRTTIKLGNTKIFRNFVFELESLICDS